jgi:hypothetical protein
VVLAELLPADWSSIAVPVLALVPLYLLFRLKQLVCDYILQTAWMVHGKTAEEHWLKPLLIHAGVHGGATALIAMAWNPSLWWLGPLDVAIHACIDRLKVLLTRSHRWGPDRTEFWWAHGIDQEAHNLTHFAYVLALLLC